MGPASNAKWLEEQMTFYSAYHYNLWNKLVHIVCVWPIFWTAQVFFFYAPVPEGLKGIFSNWTMVLSFFYGLYYFLVELPGIAGPIATILVITGYFTTKQLYDDNVFLLANQGADAAMPLWKPALAIHIICWTFQILGHQIFEKRSPAFLDNLLGAVVMAPLFVILEVLFPLGYKAELHKAVEVNSIKKIAEFRKANKEH